jgi:uncharacterized membrane protein
MTSMLYSARMTTKLNHPDDIGWKPKSWFDSFKVGAAWLFLVFLTDLPGLYLIQNNPDIPLMWRVVIAAVPLFFGFLYVRDIARWIRGMDELHRVLALESFVFATIVYLFLAAASFTLAKAGLWAALVQATHVHLERIPWNNCTFILCLTYVLFGVGYSIFKRRYQ